MTTKYQVVCSQDPRYPFTNGGAGYTYEEAKDQVRLYDEDAKFGDGCTHTIEEMDG